MVGLGESRQHIAQYINICYLFVRMRLCQIEKNTYFTHYKKKKHIVSDLDIDRSNELYNKNNEGYIT